ncbi:MAG: PRC-barrel domain-containing protein [Kiritimatiellae bacterium]|jgi:uncharacterized protein YrrD|nr:PRC-barrel domain-containing protein [Kiritimatiellia bacterium]
MKLKFETLKGFKLHAQDGEIGKIKDVLFDDHQWGGRWLVADTRNWLPGRKVLLSPISFDKPDLEEKILPVRMTKQDIKDSPPLEEDAPVSQQFEKSFFDQFYWPYYWTGGGLWANQTYPIHLDSKENEYPTDQNPEPDPENQEHVLRSADELTNYQVIFSKLLESEVQGNVADLVIDTETWAVPYLIIQNRKWLSSKKVLVPQERVVSTEWNNHSIHVNLDESALEAAPALEDGDCVSKEMEDLTNEYFKSLSS